MSKSPLYGFPHVSDPHDFHPDSELCSPEEMEAHRLACATYGKPAYKPNVGCATLTDPETGKPVGHVTRTSWGIGTNMLDMCDGCNELTFGDPLMTCHECGGPEFCGTCWPAHEKRHDDGDLR